MSTEVTLPALGESVTEGTVSRWLKEVGEHVEMDEPLLEVSTDKVDTEVPSPVSGTLLEIRVNEDEEAPVGAVLAIIGDASEAQQGAPTPQPAAPAPQPAPQPPAAPAPAPAPAASDATEVLLPALGESVTEGTVSRWLKAVGEQVAADEPLGSPWLWPSPPSLSSPSYPNTPSTCTSRGRRVSTRTSPVSWSFVGVSAKARTSGGDSCPNRSMRPFRCSIVMSDHGRSKWIR